MPAQPISPDAQRQRAVVVYNPIKVDLDALKAIVAQVEAENDWDQTIWLSTSEDDPGQGRAAEALESGAAVVIVAGGDGTVRAVAEGLKDGSIAMALIPSGTGNLLARNLDLNLDDLELSVHTAFTGVDRKIDLGLIEITRADGAKTSHVFLVMAGLGLDAKMLANTDDDLKKKAGWLAYVTGLARTLRDKNELRFRYSLNRGPFRATRAHTIIIANCGSLPSNIVLLPDAAVDDGQFDVALLRPEGFVGWVQIFVKVIWENGVLRRMKAGRALMTKEVSALRYVRAEGLSVRLERAEQIELDGDGFGEAMGFDVQVLPAGLTIKIPPTA
ncbi:diacylglycerol/lipid kinase family protein [Cryobacterium serini]|uniref:Diacylglycerol kinase n=1 Tax=Cryobacterium serini TaxID=1259201 RepID=A0A4R9BVA6_9MICO|nr:diacylglycerol kinase family protein [Cryobacterium serini]TFD90484.1 diacylglycerol kinase [Cryobacterium serini]